MPKTYNLCGNDVHSLIKSVMGQHHLPLSREGVSVQAVFINDFDDDDEARPALKVHGVPAAAKIQVTPLVDRVRGIEDAKLTIDEYTWQRLNESARLALIDHELEHLQLVRDSKTGAVKHDDHRRPKLKLRVHDWTLAGFQSIVERHGESAIEFQELARFRAEQLPLFPEGLAAL